MDHTDLEYRPGSYLGGLGTSRVYGMSGEMLINFGPMGMPVIFALFGAAVAWVQHAQARWADTCDARLLLAPFPVSLCLLALPDDSDNLLFQLVKTGTVPLAAAVALSCTRRPAILRAREVAT